MSFQTPITIAEALDNIENQRYLLPAIQREFEWPSYKIEWLFDSLMRGYPISSFLFWNVENLSSAGYRFYKFLRVFRERYRIHNEDASVEGAGNFTAVLDGQQRLTSLLIGLKGSYAYKEHRLGWKDDERNIPTRRLYLNILRVLEDQEDDRVYDFSFLKDSETKKADIHGGEWFRVGKILELKNFAEFGDYLADQKLNKESRNILAKLQQVVFSDRVINYFLEKEQDLHKALNIFIRVNSGGKPLDFSDLIMSIAIANWEKKDAREEIHGLVDKIQQVGFSISKDFIFKTYLYLYSTDIRFKVTNFSKDNAHNFEADWERIRDSIQATFELIRSFGYNDFTLTSKNAVIPIIYYLYHRDIYSTFGTAVRFKKDRELLIKWVHVMTLKRVFGAQSDATLAQIRKAFTPDVSSVVKIKSGMELFPAEDIAKQIKRDLSVGKEFIEELLGTQKDDRYAFCILALLNPQLDYRNNDFHLDHLHPISGFTKKAASALGLSAEDEEVFLSSDWNNSIVNLQMLDSNENKSKKDRTLEEWVKAEISRKERGAFLDRCMIPLEASLSLRDFATFAKKRDALLAKRLSDLLQ
jgi:uncharacterized protein with ParB-like and HNH nuclease domain